MASASKSIEVVLAAGIGMPKIEQGVRYRFAFPIQNESGQLHRASGYSRVSEIIFGGRVRLESGQPFLCGVGPNPSPAAGVGSNSTGPWS